MRFLSGILFITLAFYVNAQDTIRIMQYNLLYYGTTTSWCNPSNNNINDKEKFLKAIASYVRPDILTVNEIAPSTAIHQRLMDSALNVSGVNYYKKAGYTNNAGSDIVNMLYYNSDKLTLHSQHTINNNTRDINFYKLYYNYTGSDTAFIICIVAHLKSGTTSQDKLERADMTQKVMTFLDSVDVAGNYFFMGDFNLQSSDEESFQNLINYPDSEIRFYDPVDKSGTWHDNPDFSLYHTQSTNLSDSSNTCPAGGGLDDRFDFILVSDNVLNGPGNVRYIENSYKVLGQDGLRFNSTVKDPVNTSVTSDIADALFGLSDHLPVIIELKIDTTDNSINKVLLSPFRINFANPVTDELKLTISSAEKTDINIQIISLPGQVLFEKTLSVNDNTQYSIPLAGFENGMYLLKVADRKNNQFVYKLIRY